jgi:hypothetical protein
MDPLDVAPHPHRGFEPVTFLYQGSVRHKDSRGHEGILEAGDVQWMTAGRGIIHSERATRSFLEEGGTLEGIQLWVNLTKVHKMTTPRYQHIKKEAIPTIPGLPDGIEVRLIAGKYRGLQGPVETFTPILAMQIHLQADREIRIAVPQDFNAFSYLVQGSQLSPNGFSYASGTLLHYGDHGDTIELRTEDEAQLLLLAGTPIDEPLAQWGPYVMNTQTEILEAMRDYQMGKMGFYID